MTRIAVSVPDENAGEWIEAVAAMKRCRTIELSADTLSDRDAVALAARQGLLIGALRDLMPPEVGRHFADLSGTAQNRLVALLSARIRAASQAGAPVTSMRLGLDCIGHASIERDISIRAAFLKQLAAALDSQNVTLCLPLRCPPAYPTSREWDLAVNILQDAMHPRLRICLDIFPWELGTETDPAGFARKVGFHLGAVRLIYEPLLGETLPREFLKSWAAALRWHGFNGVAILAPRVRDPDFIGKVCRDIDVAAEILEHGLRTEG